MQKIENILKTQAAPYKREEEYSATVCIDSIRTAKLDWTFDRVDRV